MMENAYTQIDLNGSIDCEWMTNVSQARQTLHVTSDVLLIGWWLVHTFADEMIWCRPCH